MSGNYVCLNVEPSKDLDMLVLCGEKTKNYHITLIYSKGTNVPSYTIENFLNSKRKIADKLDIVGFKALKGDSNEYAIVGLFESQFLQKLHRELISDYGLKHSYDDYIIHMTLSYKNTEYDANVMVSLLNSLDWSQMNVTPINYTAEDIDV